MKQILQNLLAQLSRKILRKYQPNIIAITGSVGKTSTKEAVFSVVSQNFFTRRSEKNFNNELGLPLTIIGYTAPGKNPFLWLGLFAKALTLLLVTTRYPKILVLEMGVDRPGDMDYLVSIARPNIAVITSIGLSHYEFFKDIATLEKEKGKLAESLPANGICIVNADNQPALAQKSKTQAKALSYGIQNPADIHASILQQHMPGAIGTTASTRFLLQTPSGQFTATTKTLGLPHLLSLTAAAAIGYSLGMSPESIIKGIWDYKATPGRLNIISGIKKTTIIDDTYNAAPDSTRAALELLVQLPSSSKIAVLGDMLELGEISKQEHEKIGKLVATLPIQQLITIGAGGKIIADAAISGGMNSTSILSFDTSLQSLHAIQNLLRPGSVILIKGSQGMRMEKITKEIMAEPMRAEELLCRQYGGWVTV